MATPTLVVVGGPPGSGKTTLAHRLARAIPCPAVCRDELKEGMVHAHGGAFEPGAGDLRTRRTFPVFFEVLRVLLVAEVTVAAEVGHERALRRASNEPGRRAAHGTSALQKGLLRWREEVAAFERLSLPAPALEVDTTDGYAPSLEQVAAFARRG